MPECKLGLNDRMLLEAQGRTTKGKAIDLDDIKFHQYEICSVISFCGIMIYWFPAKRSYVGWPLIKLHNMLLKDEILY